MIKNLKDINLEDLKKNHLDLYYFGLGFIQLKIDKHTRLHFYDPELPTLTSEEDVHNHRYDFQSRILAGALQNDLFEVTIGSGGFEVYEENCSPLNKPEVHPKSCDLKLKERTVHSKGSVYDMKHEWFHRVKALGPTITFLTRTDYKKDLADVTRKKGETNICPFSKVYTKDELWSRIESMITSAKKEEG